MSKVVGIARQLSIKATDEVDMKLSTKGRYGLRALIDLAQYSEIEPVSISSIATRQGISERYLDYRRMPTESGFLLSRSNMRYHHRESNNTWYMWLLKISG